MLFVLMIAAVALHEWAGPRLYDYAWPCFDCADCIGMRQYGCECSYLNAVAPGVGPNRRQRFARWLFLRLYRNSQVY